ncbi:MAG: bifunctional [glutamate--ammonia ligase]-adenylyl-L-tyrosine phosphorylase/[glutamate--ammonia-ligase] adenylyltransferase, partial [Pseudomonadota bacterium]
ERLPWNQHDAVAQHLRRWRARQMARLAVAEMGGQLTLSECLSGLSQLADTAVRAALRSARTQMRQRYGCLRAAGGNEVPLIVIAMGKLGGDELNFSSDIDVLFAFPEAGSSDGARAVEAPEYCLREARLVIDLLDRITADGRVFRVDTRLRPFGDAGPLAISFAALEDYLQRQGRAWERYAFVKARFLATTDVPAVAQFQDSVVRPFVYRRYSDYGVLDSLRDMKRMIANEVERLGEVDDLKRGAGGIREIEFIVQSWQLIHGGKLAPLRTPRLRQALDAAIAARLIDASSAATLYDSYRFLRQLENRLQALDDQQTHEVPEQAAPRELLALVMGCASWAALAERLAHHRASVLQQFNALLHSAEADVPVGWLQLEGAVLCQRLTQVGVDDAQDIAAQLEVFAAALTRSGCDPLSEQRAHRFVDALMPRVSQFDRPAQLIARVLRFADAVRRRSAYLSLLIESESALDRLLRLLHASEFLAQQLIEHPMLLEDVLAHEARFDALSRDALQAALAEAQAGSDAALEAQMQAIVRFGRAGLFRIAVADIVAELPLMQVSDRLSDLAELSLAAVLSLAWTELTTKFGSPASESIDATHGFAIIAYGKLGGLELGYGSDLDIIFLHDFAPGDTRAGPEQTVIDNTVFAQRLARRVVHLLEIQTGHGRLYEIDTRLRPSGRSGLLVSRVSAFEQYQRNDAWTWEHQALTRARFVAGDPQLSDRFSAIRDGVLREAVEHDTLADDVIKMRARMRKELSRSGSTQMDLKQDAGGIADLEFLVQYLVLRDAAIAPEVLRWSDNVRQLDSLAAAGVLGEHDARRLQDIYRRYRRWAHARALNNEPALLSRDDLQSERQTVCALWLRELGVDPCASAHLTVSADV